MEFRLDEGQLELQQTVARFCDEHFPIDRLATREGAPVDRSTWSALAELGVLSLLVPESVGGSGLSTVDAAIVFEQLGGSLAPGPVLWSVLSAPLLDDVGSGQVLVTGVESVAVGQDGSVVVEHAADAQVLVVAHDDRVVAHQLSELDPPELLDGLDPLATVGRISGLGAGEPVGDATTAARLRGVGTTLAAASLVGLASRALQVAQEYAAQRQQFDAAIGSFQAVKHLLADMYVRSVVAQSATYAAAAVIDDGDATESARAASAAKLLAGEAAVENAATAVQVLGGMGFTWDMPPNHLLKRAWSLDREFGAIEDHEQQMGAHLERSIGEAAA